MYLEMNFRNQSPAAWECDCEHHCQLWSLSQCDQSPLVDESPGGREGGREGGRGGEGEGGKERKRDGGRRREGDLGVH